MTVIQRGSIEVDLNDADLIRGLENVRAKFKATMEDIDRQKAVADAQLSLVEFDKNVDQAKRRVRELEGLKATVDADADTTELDAKIEKARRAVKRLDGERATIEIDVRGLERALAAEKALAAVEEKRRRANVAGANDEAALARRQEQINRRSESEQLAAINRRARVSSSLRRQQEREILNAHSEALAMDRARLASLRQQAVGVHEQAAHVVQLQREYGRLGDQLERLSKKNVFSKEERIKLDLDRRGIVAKMLALKGELSLIAKHPPVEFEPKIKRTGIKRFTGFFGDLLKNVGDKAAGLGDLTARLGPFTGSIKQFGLALSFLGPTITDLVGAASSLIGVVGAGLAGAAAVGAAGLTGLGIAFGGFKFSLRNTSAEVANARTAINAYQKEVERSGKTSDKAKAKQEQMNATLRSITPLARVTAQGIERFYSNWDKHTATTQRHLTNMARGGFKALDAITPMWAKQTNKLSGVVDKNLRGAFKFLKSGEFKTDFNTIGNNFRSAMTPLLRGLGDFGRGFLNVARESSQYLKPLAQGIQNVGKSFLRFTQGDSFGSTIKRWVSYATDLTHFLGAAGRVLVHFFGDGASAGDSFLRTMTNALNRWDDFLTSTRGRNEMSRFFHQAVAGTQTLYNAFAPLIKLFAMWSAGLAPAVKVIGDIFAGVTNFVAALGQVAGLQNPIVVVAKTLGAMWAVGKIGAFLAMITRVVSAFREIRSLSTGFNFIKSLPTLIRPGLGGAGAAGEIGTTIEASGAVAAERMGAAITAAGASVAEMIGTAEVTGGAAAAAESAGGAAITGGVAGVAGAGAATAELTAVEGAAVGAEAGILGLSGAAATAATGGLALAAGALVFLGIKLLSGKTASDRLADSIKANRTQLNNWVKDAHSSQQASTLLGQSMGSYRDSVKSVSTLKKELNKLEENGGRGTQRYRDTLDALNTALEDRSRNEAGVHKYLAAENRFNRQAADDGDRRVEMQDNLNKAERNLAETRRRALHGQAGPSDIARAEALVGTARRNLANWTRDEARAQNEAAVASANYARGLDHMIPLTGKAATAIARLSRINPNVAAKVSIRYADPKDAGRVANAAQRALGRGVSQKVTLKIIADSKNAEQAIARLRAVTLAAKHLDILEHGGAAAVAMLERIIGRKLTPKEQRIAQHGGSEVIGLLGRIIGTHLNPKTFAVTAHDNATGVLGRILGLIASIHDKSATITTYQRSVISQTVQKTAHLKASGGVGSTSAAVNSATARRQANAIERIATGRGSYASSAAMLGGAKIRGVRAIYGEEPQHPEFVISTNPSYRRSNVNFLRQAADQLGVTMAAGGLSGVGGSNLSIGDLTSPGGVPETSVGLGGIAQPMHLSRNKKKRRRQLSKRANKHSKLIHAGRHPWLSRVETLQHQEDLWSREVSFREGNLEEPDDFLTEKKNADGTSTYAIDTEALSTYRAQISAIVDGYGNLVQVIKNLLQAIPKAYREAKDDIAFRNHNVGVLRNEIHRRTKHMHTLQHDNKGGKHNDEIRSAQSAIQKYKTQLAKEVTGRNEDKANLKSLSTDNENAVFDFRDALRSLNTNQQLITDSGTTANQQLADAQGTGGGGGAGGGGPTYGEQLVSAGNEKLDILRQYGGNVGVSRTYGAAMPTGKNTAGGGGIVANPAGTLPSSAPSGHRGAIGFAGSSSVASSSAASAAVSARSVAAPSGGSAGPAGVAAGGTTVTVNNTFATVPPDPHTWSRGVAFELGSVV